MHLENLMNARNSLLENLRSDRSSTDLRNLAETEPWELSTLRSRTRRRASELQFVPTATRARRVSLGTLIAIAAGPAAGLANANGNPHMALAPTTEPPTTTEHHIQLENGSKAVRYASCSIRLASESMASSGRKLKLLYVLFRPVMGCQSMGSWDRKPARLSPLELPSLPRPRRLALLRPLTS
jgi:hypothetical protein